MNELKWVEWIEVSRMNGWKWTRTTLWQGPYELRMSVPIKVTWDEWFDQTLSKWMDSMRNEWIEVNRTIWGEMSDLKDLTWMNPMGMVLWSEEGEPY